MRLFLTAAAITIMSACSPTVAAPDSLAATQTLTAPAEDTEVLAVLSYASWCGSCKVLDPKVTAARAANDFDGVEFFALDYSARDADTYFAAADTLGIGETMRRTFPSRISTGRLYLINKATGEVVSEVTKSMDEAEITDAINAALAGA